MIVFACYFIVVVLLAAAGADWLRIQREYGD